MKKLKEIIDFIVSYREKVIFFACLSVLVIILFSYFLDKEKDEFVLSVEKQTDELSKIIETNEPHAIIDKDYSRELKKIWEDMVSAQAGRIWLMYRQPVFVVRFKEKATIIQRSKVFLPPILKEIKKVDKIPDRVMINWEKNKETTAEVKNYGVYRRSVNEKDFTLIVELSLTALTPTDIGYLYTDKGLKAETEYWYYITAISDAGTQKQESGPSNQLKIITSLDYEIEFRAIDKEMVFAVISKYIGEKWDKESFTVKKGEPIGKAKFVTGCILLDIQPHEILKGTLKIPTFRIVYLDKKKESHSTIIEPK
jgi:hypothetical protein